MGLFGNSESKNARNEKLVAKSDEKARIKAEKQGFEVEDALFVAIDLEISASHHSPVVILYPNRVAKMQKKLTGVNIEEIPIEKISSLELSKGMLPTVKIHTSGNSLTFKTDAVNGAEMVKRIRSIMNTSKEPSATVDAVSQLEKLASLLEKGLISREEFDKKKTDLLG